MGNLILHENVSSTGIKLVQYFRFLRPKNWDSFCGVLMASSATIAKGKVLVQFLGAAEMKEEDLSNYVTPVMCYFLDLTDYSIYCF